MGANEGFALRLGAKTILSDKIDQLRIILNTCQTENQ